MRYLDIAVAVMIGLSAVSSMAVWTPSSGDSDSARMALLIHNRDRLLAFVEERGLPWLVGTPIEEVCRDLARGLNDSASVYVSVGQRSCGAIAPAGAPASNLTIPLLHSEVTLQLWPGA